MGWRSRAAHPSHVDGGGSPVRLPVPSGKPRRPTGMYWRWTDRTHRHAGCGDPSNMAARAAKDEVVAITCLLREAIAGFRQPETLRFWKLWKVPKSPAGENHLREDTDEKLEVAGTQPEHPRANLLHQLAMLPSPEAITLGSAVHIPKTG